MPRSDLLDSLNSMHESNLLDLFDHITELMAADAITAPPSLFEYHAAVVETDAAVRAERLRLSPEAIIVPSDPTTPEEIEASRVLGAIHLPGEKGWHTYVGGAWVRVKDQAEGLALQRNIARSL